MRRIPEKWLVVITVLLGTFTVILNNSMLNPVLPHFMNIFNTDAVTVGWILTIFMVAMGIVMPLTGYLGDKYGKKNLYILGLFIFIIGSTLGTFAWNIESLILFRAIQGLACGIMMPLSMALIFEVFPKNERGTAIGIYGVSAMVAPTVGPTVGGIITEMASWHYIFLFNIPFGIFGLIFATLFLKSSEKKKGIRFDKVGFVTVTIGIGAILYALGRISEVNDIFRISNVILLTVGTLSLIVFVKHENRVEQPLLNLSVFRIKTFSISVWITAISSIGIFATIFLIPLLIQNVFAGSVIMTGLVFLPHALISGLFMSIGGRLLDRNGPRGVVTIGLIILSVTTLLLSFLSLSSPVWVIVLLMIFRGMGMGLCNIPATTAGMNAIPEQMIAQGSAMTNVVRQMSSSMGVVFISIYYEVRKSQIFANGLIETQATLSAINEAFFIVGILTALTIPFGFFLESVKNDNKLPISPKVKST